MIALTSCQVADQKAADSPKFAFVRTGLLMEQVEIAAKGREQLAEAEAEFNNNKKTLEEEMKTMHESFISTEKDLSKEEREARIRQLAEKEGELERYHFSTQRMMQQKEQEIMEPIINTINSRIAKYAEENNYGMIWGTLTQGNVLYGQPELDVTEDIIKYINSKK
jgi:outer membrane protein